MKRIRSDFHSCVARFSEFDYIVIRQRQVW
jgi:hypothetical protein